MNLPAGKITIFATDQVTEGLLVHFSDGISVLYHAQFLYDVQNQDGNKAILDEPEEDEAES